MNFLKDILKGALIGVANAIPGVSGGTMMVSMGIYDEVIYCITHLFKQFKRSVAKLLPYFIGMAAGIVCLAFSIESLYANFPLQTSMAFIGLIIGGVPLIWSRVGKKVFKPAGAGIFLLFFAAMIAMQIFGGAGRDAALSAGLFFAVKIFFIGAIASATMVIPGVSGSMILMMLGYYHPIMNAVADFVSFLAGGEWRGALELCASLVPFGLGVCVGIFAIAKLIEVLLSRFEQLTYCAILGLVVSSPIVILMQTDLSGAGPVSVAAGVIAAVAGAVVAKKLGE